MARTPSKITKRDIDKNLYMEIVSEANNKTNIQKLLDDYVRKDESIGEWQLPDSYRTSLTSRINNMDADLQVLKEGKTQKAINENIEQRLEVVEKSQGIKKDEDDDSDTSLALGTQVGANTTNISKHEKRIDNLETRMTNVENTNANLKYQYQSEDNKVRDDLGAQISATTKRMSELETSLAGKRNTADLITEGDLDEGIKKKMKNVLSISDKTFDALNKMDAPITRIDTIQNEADENKKAIDATNESIAATKSELLQDILDKANETNAYVSDSTKTIQDSIASIRNDMASSSTEVNTRFNSVNEKDKDQDARIAANASAIESVSSDTSTNAAKIRHNEDSITELEEKIATQKTRVEQNASDIKAINESKGKCYGIEAGKMLSIGDSDGTIIGKSMFIRTYVVNDDDEMTEYFTNSNSPIVDLRTGMLYTIKTAEEIAADAEAAASGSTGAESEGTTGSGTDEPVEEPSEEMKKLLLRYKQTPQYTSTPECRNTFIFDIDSNMLVAFVGDDGVIESFTTKAGGKKLREVEITSGNSVEYPRDDAFESKPITVYVLDDNESSKTYGKWLNSEGVATVAYGFSSYMVVNNSNQMHRFRILED